MIRIIVFAWAALLFLVAPSRAQSADAITPDLLCRVQNAIRWREPAWTAEKCATIAAALSATSAPRTMLAIALNESDLRERAIAWHGPLVADVGLIGIRCVLDKHGRTCTNGPTRGYTVEQLRDGETSIAVANVLMVSNGGDVSRWNPGSEGYASRIAALSSALVGVRVKVSSRRGRKLIEQILAVVGPGKARQ